MDNRDNQERTNDEVSKSTPAPDPETLNTTDPQKNMKGPFSSTMRGTGEAFKTDQTKHEADQEKDEKI